MVGILNGDLDEMDSFLGFPLSSRSIWPLNPQLIGAMAGSERFHQINSTDNRTQKMKYHSKYALKAARRQKAPKVARNVLVNARGDIVGPLYGVEFKFDHVTDKMVPHRDPSKPVFPKEIHAVPFSWELAA